MERSAHRRFFVAAAMVAAAGLPTSVLGRQPEAAAPTEAGAPAGVPVGGGLMRFNFSEAPFGDVVDAFARQFALPVIREAQVPGGTMTFISAEAYALAEALEIFNLNLLVHGVRLVREENFLYLRTTAEAARKPTAVIDPAGLDGMDPTEYVTVTVPLNNAAAPVVAEQIKPLVKEPGMVQAIPGQNLVVIVETAAQARRIRELVQRIDAVRAVDSQYKIFRLRNAKAQDAVNALRGLVGQRIQKQIIEKDGSVRQVEEIDLAGLSIEPDERTNSVICVGSSSRLETVEQLIALLDQPEGGVESGEVTMSSYRLGTVTAAAAKAQLEALFRGLPANRQPVVVGLDEVAKIVVVGERGLVLRATALLGEMDPAGGEDDAAVGREGAARVVPLRHLSAEQAQAVAQRMLSPRQNQVLRYAASPGGGLLIAGPARDVDALAALITGIDVPAEGRREVRRVRLDGGDPAAVVAEATRLDGLAGGGEADPVEVIGGADAAEVTLVGSRAGLERFEARLRDAQAATTPRTSAAITAKHVTASTLADGLRRLAAATTEGTSGLVEAVTFEAFDELAYVMVRGTATQIAAAQALAAQLDRESVVGRAFRVVQAGGDDPAGLIERAKSLYATRSEGLPTAQAGAVSVEASGTAGRYVARGSEAGLALFDSIVAELSALTAPVREERFYEAKHADATGLAAGLRRMLEQSPGARAGAPVEIGVAEGLSGTVRIVADAGQQARIEEMLRLLDRADVQARTYTLKVARAGELAGRLGRLAEAMLTPSDGRPYRAPEIEGLDDLSMVVVRATADQFAAIDALVEQLDATRPGDRQVRVLPLRGPDPAALVARAEVLYAGSGRPAAEAVETEYDAASGTLIVRGRAEGVARFAEVLEEAGRLLPPERRTRLIEVRNIEAARVLEPLRALLSQADPIDAFRAVPEPVLRVVEQTNSLLVTAEEAQHALIAEFVSVLDSADPVALPPLRLLQLRSADVNAVAGMLTEQYEARPLVDRTARPVQVRADAATGTLIVSAHAELFDEIREFVSQLNAEASGGPERETFIFPLKVARAVDVAAAMDKLYPAPPVPVDRRGVPMPWLAEPKEVTVSADASSNALIIDAPAERRESLEKLAETLDQVQAPATALLRTYRIVNADLDAVANMLRGLARRGTLSGPAQPGRQPVEAVIEVEPRSSTLIVAGDETTFAQVEGILEDLTAVPVERGLRIVPIANAPAAAVRERAVAIYSAQVAQVEGAGEVDVRIDETSNSLEVVADAEAMDRFMAILEELQRQIGPARQVRLVELRLARAGEVIATLRELVAASESFRVTGGPAPVFEPIESTNSIMVAAQPDQFAIIESLIRSLDDRESLERPPLRILRLRSTDAASIAAVLEQSFGRRPAEERAVKPVSVEADPATNTLIVSAHADVLPEIEAIVSELNDTAVLERDGREIRIFPLKVARAEELARTIDQMYPEPPMPRDRRGAAMPWLQEPKEVVVRADAATNALIVDAPGPRLAGFEQLVRSLDTLQVDAEAELRTFTIQRADLSAVAETIRGLAAGNALGASSRTPVTVSVEPTSRTVIVGGPASVFARIEQVIAEIDGDSGLPATTLRMFPLKFARAERVADLLRGLLETRLRETLKARGAVAEAAGGLLEVTPDRGSNTLIISAPDEVHAIAEQLIQALDTEGASVGRAVIRVVPLTFASAFDVAETINAALPSLEFPAGGPVSVSAAAGSNALLLTGAGADLKVIEGLIEPLDRQPFDPEKPSVETFALEHAGAAEIAGTVERLLIEQQQTDPRVLALRMRFDRSALVEPPRVRVEADERTNSLVVSGPAQVVDLARSVIERLDMPARDGDRRLVTFTPARADAARLAASVIGVLTQTMAGERRPVEISADDGSGAVLIVGSEAQCAEALRLAAEFDDRTPAMPLVEMRAFELASAGAESVAGIMLGVLEDRSRWPEDLRRAAAAGLPLPAATVAADASQNRLLVSAPAGLMPLAAELVATLDKPRGEGAVDVRVFRLIRGDASAVAEAIRAAVSAGLKPGEVAATVTAEAKSNTIVMSASGARLAQAEGLIAAMDDIATEPATVGVRTIFLRHARAESVAPIVESVLAEDNGIDENTPWWIRQEIEYQRAARGETGAASIKVAAEPRLNAVVVSAPVAVLELAEEVVRGLDIDPGSGPGGARIVRVIALSNADAAELAESITAVFEDDGVAGGAGGVTPPTVRVDRGSNALIVSATAAQMGEVERLAASIDDATLSTRREMRTIPIDRSRASAADMARTLERLLKQRGGVKVEVLSIDELLKGRDDEAIDGAGEEGAMLERGPGWRGMVFVAIAAAATAQTAEAEVVVTPDPAPKAEPDLGPATVTIAVDPRTNALVVVGSPRLTEQLAVLAAELERELPAEPTAVRVIALPEGVDPRGVASIVEETIRQVGTATAENPGGFTGRASVTADPEGGSLIVWANDTDFAVLGEIIAGVSRPERSRSVTVKVYPLTNIESWSAQRAVRDLVSAAPQGRQARRVRELELTVTGPDGVVTTATVDPSEISVTADPSGTALIVAAPTSALTIIDRFVSVLDQSPVADRMAIRRYELVNARAGELAGTVQELVDAQRQGPGGDRVPRATVVADARTNAILVTGTEEQHEEVARLVRSSDISLELASLEVVILPLRHARPSAVQRAIQEVLVGRDAGRAERISVTAQDDTGQLIVRAAEAELAEVRELATLLDQPGTGSFPVRSIKLERADARAVAAELSRFFRERARVSGQRGSDRSGDAAIIGEQRSGTLVIAASDEDYAEIADLAAQFDAPSADRTAQFRVIPLKTARAADVVNTLNQIAFELQYERTWGRGPEGSDVMGSGRVFVSSNQRTNSVLVFGEGEIIETMASIVAELDRSGESPTAMVVRAVRVENADLRALERLIETVTSDPDRPWWFDGRDPEQVLVEVDTSRRLLIMVGQKDRVDEAASYVEQLSAAAAGAAQPIETIPLQHASAESAARSLNEFFRARARSEQRREDSVAVIGSREGNVLIVTAPPEDAAVLRDLIAQIDRPELSDARRIEVYRLGNTDPQEAAGTLSSMFPSSGAVEDRVIVTPQPSINALIVSAPDAEHARVAALLDELDKVRVEDAASIMRVPLESARAADVAALLTEALPPELKVRITAEPRTNTLLVTGSDEALAVVRSEIGELDKAVERQPVVFRRFALVNADDSDLAFTLRTLLRNRPRGVNDPQPSVDFSTTSNSISVTAGPDEMAFIEEMVRQLDVAEASARRTEFIKLQYADARQTGEALAIFFGSLAPEAQSAAEREVSIYSDSASNSLVISGPESVFEKIRLLLTTLDTEEYDTSKQLVVIPLTHADAASVARALNEGFRAPLEQEIARDEAREQSRGATGRGGEDSPAGPQRTVLVSAEETPSVSAEVQTNALVVFAGRKDLDRIRQVVQSLDVPDFQRLPAPRLIPIEANLRPSEVAESVRRVFAGRGNNRGPDQTVLVGDDAAGVLIVRAPDEAFAQIVELVRSLGEGGGTGAVSPRLVMLEHASAARLRDTLLAAMRPIAARRGEELTIGIDRPTNALVISASQGVHDQVEALAKKLDAALAPAAQSGDADAGGVPAADDDAAGPDWAQAGDPMLVPVTNVSPAEMVRLLSELGLTSPPPADRPGLVSEPVTLVALTSRSAVAVTAGRADRAKVASLIERLDAAPLAGVQSAAVVPLRLADAQRLVPLLENLLSPTSADGRTDPAAALAEQVRRLGLSSEGIDAQGLELDLAAPIRLLADPQTNAVLVASTEANIVVLREVIAALDGLPLGDAVVVRFFPLENASAARVRSVIDDLFARGEALSRLPGTRRQARPTTTTGQALAGEIAVSVDERTNALVVAGREEAVALVEVLVAELDDADAEHGYVEASLLPLKHADAVSLASKLRDVLIDGIGDTPEDSGLQRQAGRLRLVLEGGDGADARRVQGDIFAPLTGLAITPEENLNALIVVGTPANTAVVRELAGLLDVELASAANAVRVIPLTHAEAGRVASVAQEIFAGREVLETTRDEDRLVISVDERTNALIVSTSARSFAILEGLLRTLDQAESRFAVGMHVIPVPGADVRDLAPKIQRLMQERISAQRQRGGVESPLDVFSIEPVPASELLLVACSEENLVLVRELIAALTDEDEAVAGAETFELIPLESAGRSLEIADAIEELYVTRENEKRGQRSVSVVPSARQNALLVTGTAEDIARVRELANRLDVAQVETVQEVKRIALRAANAFELVQLLEELLAGRPIGGRGQAGAAQATRLRFYQGRIDELEAESSATEATIDGALREQVRLTADLRTNSVLVSSPPTIMKLIEEIIRDLDAETSGDRRVEQFRLVNADAQQMALLLSNLFNLEQQGDRLVLVPRQRPAEFDALTGEPVVPDGTLDDSLLTPVPDQRQALAITVDRRTNTLLVSATPDYLEEVRRVVNELDKIEANERERLVYELNHAQAKEVEETLKSYFAGEAELRRSTLGPQLQGSLARQLEEEVTVVGDEKSNKLLISASPRYIAAVEELVRELDRPPPQVLIQVLLAEVTLDNDFTFGVDFNVGLDTATSRIGNDGYVFEQLAAGAGVATALGVPNFSVLSQDFRLLVRALEVQGKLEVLSRPHVTVRNNEEARIQVGEDVGIPVGTDAVGERVSINIERRDIGIILNVRPSIASDGTVRMDIAPEISSLSPNSTALGNGTESPVITQRQVETTVTVGDGQTIVIGGLIQTTNSVQESKIPLLGDLPLVGAIFRTAETNVQKTELLVILTPTVIPGDIQRAEPIQKSILGNRIGSLADPTAVLNAIERDTINPGDADAAAASWWEADSPGLAGPEVIVAPAGDRP